MASPSQSTVELDELRILIVVDNETDTLSSIDDGMPQLPEVASLISRLPSLREFNGHACKPIFEHLCCACHGFSGPTGVRDAEVVVNMVKRQLLAQAVLALAQRRHTPSHGGHMLTDRQVDALNEGRIDLPAVSRKHLLNRLQRPKHDATADPR